VFIWTYIHTVTRNSSEEISHLATNPAGLVSAAVPFLDIFVGASDGEVYALFQKDDPNDDFSFYDYIHVVCECVSVSVCVCGYMPTDQSRIIHIHVCVQGNHSMPFEHTGFGPHSVQGISTALGTFVFATVQVCVCVCVCVCMCWCMVCVALTHSLCDVFPLLLSTAHLRPGDSASPRAVGSLRAPSLLGLGRDLFKYVCVSVCVCV
jgi:hypothetical protein